MLFHREVTLFLLQSRYNGLENSEQNNGRLERALWKIMSAFYDISNFVTPAGDLLSLIDFYYNEVYGARCLRITLY